jgi:hypothetical protein
MTMGKSAKGVQKLSGATEVPRDCNDKPLFPSKGRHHTQNNAVLSTTGLGCGCESWRDSD